MRPFVLSFRNKGKPCNCAFIDRMRCVLGRRPLMRVNVAMKRGLVSFSYLERIGCGFQQDTIPVNALVPMLTCVMAQARRTLNTSKALLRFSSTCTSLLAPGRTGRN
jgi:hypothetical protein